MSGWTEFAFPLPDDNFATIKAIMRSLPQAEDIETVWSRMPHYVVQVADQNAALFLRLAVTNGLPTGDDGSPLLGPNEVWVAEHERAECERILAEECPSASVWTSFARVAFASAEAHRQFRAAFVRIAECEPPAECAHV